MVENVRAGVITSPPTGRSKASIPIYKADDPELTNKQLFLLNKLAILDSNSLDYIFPSELIH